MNFSKSISILILLSFTVISCRPNPPEIVINSFSHQFPEAKNIGWKLEYNGLWRAFFYITEFEYIAAFYNNKGAWISTEKEIFIGDVSSGLLKSLQEKYPRALIVNSFERENSVGKAYEFEIEEDGAMIVIGYDESKSFFVMEDETFQINNEFTVEND